MEDTDNSQNSNGSIAPKLFNPITTVRVSSIIVERVRTLIRAGKLQPGDKLPTEKELCSSFGIGRATVRDALRVLETLGLIEIKVGSRGGAFVTAPSTLHIASGISDMIASSTLSAAEVREARLSFEVGLLDLVCERVTERDLQDLDAICDEAKRAVHEGDYTLELSLQFHRALAHCAHNRALDMIVDTFQASLEMFERPIKEGDPGRGHPGVQEHCDLLEAVRSRNVTLAKAILELHRSRTPTKLRLIA